MSLFKYLARSFRRYEPCSDDYALASELTLACWFHGNHYVTDQHIIGTPSVGYRLFLRSIDNLSYLGAQIGGIEIIDTDPIIDRSWIHAAVVWDGELFQLFKNGKLTKTTVASTTYGQRYLDRSIWAFHNNPGGNASNLGISYFTIWNIALPNDDVKQLADIKTGNVALFHPSNIIIGDLLDEPNTEGVFGTKIPCRVVNEHIFGNISSPFNGPVPFDPPEELSVSTSDFGSSLSSSVSSIDSLSSITTSSTSISSDTSNESESTNTSNSSISTNTSSTSTSSSTDTSSTSTSSTSSTDISSLSSVSNESNSSVSTPSSQTSTSTSGSSPTSQTSSTSSTSSSSDSSATTQSTPSTASTNTSSTSSDSTPTSQTTSSTSSDSTPTSPTSQTTSSTSSDSTQTSLTSSSSSGSDQLIAMAGLFTEINSTTRNYAAITDINGTLQSFNPPNTSPSGGTYNGAVGIYADSATDTVIVSYTKAADNENRYLRQYDFTGTAKGWSEVIVRQLSGVARTHDILIDGTTVYVSGVFASVAINGGSHQTISNILKITTSASLAATQLAVDSSAYEVKKVGSNIFVLGIFVNAGTMPPGGSPTYSTRNNIASWNTSSTLQAFSTGAVTGGGASLYSFDYDGSSIIYVSGDFTAIGGTGRTDLAAFNATTGALQGWAPTTNGSVTPVLKYLNSIIYIIGNFTQVNATSRTHVAALDTSGVLTSFQAATDNPFTAFSDGRDSLDVLDNLILFGGVNFTTIQGQSRAGIALFDDTATIQSFNPTKNGDVVDIRFVD